MTKSNSPEASEGKPNISPCTWCYCQTKTIDGKCGKCGGAKPTPSALPTASPSLPICEGCGFRVKHLTNGCSGKPETWPTATQAQPDVFDREKVMASLKRAGKTYVQPEESELELELRNIFDEVYQFGGTGIAGARLVMELYAPRLDAAKREAAREELERIKQFSPVNGLYPVTPDYLEMRLKGLGDRSA